MKRETWAGFITALLFCALLITSFAVRAQDKFSWKTGDSGGYRYKYVTNDPLKTRYYTLKNGLTVILSQNTREPHIAFRMAVRAGSNTDPKTNTGLAHYLEHLLFKGTDRYGTLNYAKEEPLLKKIEDLYEIYRHTTDEAKRKTIYKQIDAVSGEASVYAIANEYDKMMKAIGSRSTNAYTSAEKTVYIEDLPSNALDKFLAVQGERFRNPVFRIFHTELEAVYEEKNKTIDDERTRMYQKMMYALFPTHNYGQQTTIGTTEHLKNPSLKEIRNYYEKYYVPNNMALIMAGDFDYDQLIPKIDKMFAYMSAKPLAAYSPVPEQELKGSQTIVVPGPGTENLYVSFRGTKENSRESLLLELISRLLSNGRAGLIDIHINQQQKMLAAGARFSQMKDYSVFTLTGTPAEGQTLMQAKDMLLSQIGMIKNGDFDESLIKATVANMKFSEMEDLGNNDTRAENLVNAFVLNRGQHWDKMLGAVDRMSKVTKQEIVSFANRFFSDNYVAVLKQKGEDKSIVKVIKPDITAIKTNADKVSPFAAKIMAAPVKPIPAKFLDYQRDLNFTRSGIAEVISVKNTDNELFFMTYRFDLGSNHNKLLPYASRYLAFLGNDKYTAQDINRSFYNIACSYDIFTGPEETVISVTGLQENFEKAVSLLEDVLLNCRTDEAALASLKSRILKSRNNAKSNKDIILSRLQDYAQYGPDNPSTYGLTNREIGDLKGEDLVQLIHNLNQYKHTITYYGPHSAALFSAEIARLHPLPGHFKEAPSMKKFAYTKISQPKVFFTNYDMVQTDVYWIRNTGTYHPSDAATIFTFNNYFGSGTGSVVFQTLRESKALAYSTYAIVWTPDSREKETSGIAYISSQADKINDAIDAMNELLTEPPVSESAFALSKSSMISSLETSRTTNGAIILSYLADKKLGYGVDSHKEQYEAVKSLRLDDMIKFHKQNLSGKPFNYCVIGSENNVNPAALERLGTVTHLSLEQLFGY